MRALLVAFAVSAKAAPAAWNASAIREARVREVARWLDGAGAAAPSSWSVRSKYDLSARWEPLSAGEVKEVFAATYADPDGTGGAEPDRVVVKTMTAPRKGTAKEVWKRDRQIRAEIMYLSYLAGEPGVPRLYGGWRSDNGSRLSYVVANAGGVVAEGKGTRGQPYRARAPWATYVEESPLYAARALLRCFRSFSEVGGYFLEDYDPHQFAFTPPRSRKKKHRATGAVFLVDGPMAMSGYMRSLSLEAGLRVFPPKAEARVNAGAACAADADCPHTASKHCCCGFKGSDDACAPNADGTIRGAPEARGRCSENGRCADVTAATHVHDFATTPWALPLAVREGARKLAHDDRKALHRLQQHMAAPDPRDRPTFTQALAALDAIISGT